MATSLGLAQVAEPDGELALMKAKWAHLLSISEEGICELDDRGRVKKVNPALARMLGFPAEEVQGHLLTNFVWDRKTGITSLGGTQWHRRPLRKKRVCFRSCFGKAVWVELSSQPLPSDSGTVCTFVEQPEVDESKAEEINAENEELQRLNQLFEQLPMGFLVKDNSGHVIAANSFFAELCGTTVDGAFDVDWRLNVFHDDLIKVKNGQTCRVRFVVSEDVHRWIEIRTLPLNNYRNHKIAEVLLFTDVSMEVDALYERDDYRDQIQGMTRGAQEGHFLIDVKTGRFLASERLSFILGFEGLVLPDNLRWMKERFHPEDRSRFEADYNAHVKNGYPIQNVYRVQLKQGAYRFFSVRAEVIRDGLGATQKVSGSFVDVTELRYAQQALASAEARAQASLRAQTTCLANFCRDIRRPTYDVVAMSGLLMMVGEAHDDDYLRTLRSSAHNLLSVVNEILDYARLESGELTLENHVFDVAALLEDVVDDFYVQARDRKLDLNAVEVIPVNFPTYVKGDAARIRQILANMVGNAIKFTDKGWVSLKLRMIDIYQDCVNFQIEVIDTGAGIDKSKHEEIFDSFSRLSLPGTRGIGGTGLGLTIARRLVRLMGGSIKLDSAPGKGSTFIIELSLSLARPNEIPETKVTKLSGKKILVVEENPENARILANQLAGWEARCQLALDGSEALSYMIESRGEPYGAVLISEETPSTGAKQLLAAIRAYPSIAETPLALMADDISILKDGHQGFDSFIVKPVRRVRLQSCLEALVSSRRDLYRTSPISSDVLNLGLDVLVIAENPVHQMVTDEIISRWGCQIDIAETESKGYRYMREKDYDIVLMELNASQSLESLEMIQEVRCFEAERLSEPVPLVVVSDELDSELVDAAYTAGVNEIIGQPIQPERLLQALKKWTDNYDIPDEPILPFL